MTNNSAAVPTRVTSRLRERNGGKGDAFIDRAFTTAKLVYTSIAIKV